ncbi:thymidylate synthase [Yoonia sp.]|uniref:thymidylate synthase n=1 Tax=Yoonia sp. TaxID=2212373 RepID=UPI003F6A95B5
MKIYAVAFAAAALLSACDDVQSPTDVDPGTGTPVTPVTPAEGVAPGIAANLQSVTFDPAVPGSETLLVTLKSLDGDTLATPYQRNATDDLTGYIAFTQQDDPLDRFATALAAASTDGTSQAVVVMDGGQFNRYFGGANYAQIGDYTAPESGLASYAGSYVGLLNVSPAPTPVTGAPDVLLPERPGRVSGDIFFNVDFADNGVNGAIYNRSDVDGVGVTLGNVILVDGALAADGSFAGNAENESLSGIGTFAGVLGGTDASSMSGGVHLDGDFAGISSAEEYGIFVLSQCGTAGETAVCSIVEDVNE